MTIAHSDALASTVLTAGMKNVFNTTGIIRIYSGAAPGPNAAPTGTLLSTVGINVTAFATPGAATRVLTANPLTNDTSAAGTGTAGYFRVKLSGDADTAVATLPRIEGTVTVTGSGGDMQLNSTSINAGGQVSITSWSYTFPA